MHTLKYVDWLEGMSNMSYQKVYLDLLECFYHFNDEPSSDSEASYKTRLIRLCKDIAEECEE